LKKISKIHRINRKSSLFLGNGFVSFHLILNSLFYVCAFVLPAISFIDCQNGFSIFSMLAMAVYMLMIFIVDLIILNQYVHTYFDEISFRKKLSSYEWILELLMVLSKCLYELVMTQIGLFKIFTDYSFIYIVS